MPSIALDTKRWTKVAPGPEDESITVTPRGFACFYSNSAEPPEKASEGTEAGTGTGLTFEVPRWFRAKEPSSTEAPVQPSILEVEHPEPDVGVEVSTGMIEGLAVTTAKIAGEAVTAPKIGTAAVEEAKIKGKAVSYSKLSAPGAVPASKPKEVQGGFAAPASKIPFNITGKKVAEPTKWELTHSLTTTAVNVTVYKKSTNEPLLNAAGAGNFTWKIVSSSVVEVIFGTEPAEGEEFIASVWG